MSQGVFIDTIAVFSDERFEWAITEGTAPYSTTVALPRQLAEELYQSQISAASSIRPFKAIQFVPTPGDTVTFTNVFIAGIEPHYNPRYLTLTLVDNRYFWNRVHFKGAFNVRTRVGNKFVVDTTTLAGLGEVPKALQDSLGFRSFSLLPSTREKEGTTVQTKVSITEIIKKICEKLKNHEGTPVFNYDKESPILNAFKDFYIEDIWIDTNCASALDQILSYVPQLGIFPDEEGVVRFFNRYDGSEVDNLNALAPGFDENGSFYYVSSAATCPKKINVLFTREHELRFDFEEMVEPAPGASVVAGNEFRSEKRTLFNVCTCPDLELTLEDGTKVFQGQFVPFSKIVAAWKGLKDGTDVSFAKIQDSFVMGNWFYAWTHVGDFEPLVDWNNRISRIKSEYRQQYQINKNWMDKMIGIKAHRVSLVDNATGTYSPSPIFQNYAIWLSERGAIAAAAATDIGKYDYILNIKEFTGSILTSKPCGPARLNISDTELGVLFVDFSYDPLRHYSVIFPSEIINAPTFKLGSTGVARFLDEDPGDGLNTSLARTHKMSTIITASPAPNSDIELYKIEVKLDDLSEIEQFKSLHGALKGAVGAPTDLRISQNIQTARLAWDDLYAAEIEYSFGIGAKIDEPKPIDDLLVNKEILKEVAVKACAAIWAKYVTRFKGELSGPIAKIRPKGTASSISFISNSDGSTECRVKLDNVVSSPDFINLLSPGTRAFILQQVGSKG